MSASDLDALRRQLALPPAPMVTTGLALTAQFFELDLGLNPADWMDYLRGIDFHHPVRIAVLPAGTVLIRHESLRAGRPKPFIYFTSPGTSPTATGTSFPAVQFMRFRIASPTRALVSTASAISFNDVAGRSFDRVSRPGGGRQFIIAARDAPAAI